MCKEKFVSSYAVCNECVYNTCYVHANFEFRKYDTKCSILTLIERTGPTLYIEYRYEYWLMSRSVVPAGSLWPISFIIKWANCSIRFGVPPMHTNCKQSYIIPFVSVYFKQNSIHRWFCRSFQLCFSLWNKEFHLLPKLSYLLERSVS